MDQKLLKCLQGITTAAKEHLALLYDADEHIHCETGEPLDDVVALQEAVNVCEPLLAEGKGEQVNVPMQSVAEQQAVLLSEAEAELRRLGHIIRYMDDEQVHLEDWTQDGEYMPCNPVWQKLQGYRPRSLR